MGKIVKASTVEQVSKLIQSLPKKSVADLKPKYDQDNGERDDDKVAGFGASVFIRSRLPRGVTPEVARDFLEWQHDNVARPGVEINEEYIDKCYPSNHEKINGTHNLAWFGLSDPKTDRFEKLKFIEERARTGYEVSESPEYEELDHHTAVNRWWGLHYLFFGKLLAITCIIQGICMLQYTDAMSYKTFAYYFDKTPFSDLPKQPDTLDVPNYVVVQRDENGRFYIEKSEEEQVMRGEIPSRYYEKYQDKM